MTVYEMDKNEYKMMKMNIRWMKMDEGVCEMNIKWIKVDAEEVEKVKEVKIFKEVKIMKK